MVALGVICFLFGIAAGLAIACVGVVLVIMMVAQRALSL